MRKPIIQYKMLIPFLITVGIIIFMYSIPSIFHTIYRKYRPNAEFAEPIPNYSAIATEDRISTQMVGLKAISDNIYRKG